MVLVRVTVAAPEAPALPYTIRVAARAEVTDKIAIARGFSEALGMAIEADPDLQDDWLLVFPDGSNRFSTIDQDDSFLVTPRDMAEIERARVPSHRAARSNPSAHMDARMPFTWHPGVRTFDHFCFRSQAIRS